MSSDLLSYNQAMPRLSVFFTILLIPFVAVAIQLDDGTFLFDEETPMPPGVMATQNCGDDESGFGSRRPFAGGFIFTIRCASNNENFNETLVFAADAQGKDARLLLFPGPEGRRNGFEDVLSNIRWHPDKNEIGELAVDSDPDSRPTPNVCRSEGQWRLEGQPPEPKLVFWRETADCRGKTGWTVTLGRR
jgi:hypothetical protein